MSIILVNLLRHRCYDAEVYLPVNLTKAQILLCWSVLIWFLALACQTETLFQMCGRLYLPLFLLRVGFLSLTYMASFMALAIFWPSLAMIFKFSTVVMLPVMFWCSKTGNGVFKCTVVSLFKSFWADSPIYSSSYSFLPHLNQSSMYALFCNSLCVFWE